MDRSTTALTGLEPVHAPHRRRVRCTPDAQGTQDASVTPDDTNLSGRDQSADLATPARPIALLFVMQSAAGTGHGRFDLHVVNVGNVAAVDASWRVRARDGGSADITTRLGELPAAIAPGDDLVVARVNRTSLRPGMVDVILQWTQPCGTIDESQHTLH